MAHRAKNPLSHPIVYIITPWFRCCYLSHLLLFLPFFKKTEIKTKKQIKPRVVSTHFSRICFTSGYITRVKLLRDCKPRVLGRQQTTVYTTEYVTDKITTTREPSHVCFVSPFECFEVDKFKLLDGGKHHIESFK